MIVLPVLLVLDTSCLLNMFGFTCSHAKPKTQVLVGTINKLIYKRQNNKANEAAQKHNRNLKEILSMKKKLWGPEGKQTMTTCKCNAWTTKEKNPTGFQRKLMGEI